MKKVIVSRSLGAPLLFNNCGPVGSPGLNENNTKLLRLHKLGVSECLSTADSEGKVL